ncbi:sugar phosphate isomerase/epimerase family protein [Tunturiibacter gelidoferens]|uniref:Sugar phosphate isomerase/epimerase n=1 Tax=Tunturiibacter gelidiferens TaxID=3069689 RepID=A0ACC5P2A2_9BACT|nr:sugar phosphate isomerase/epimerase [Edaphobacter lichenicola]MBB5340977.1 sugar phosphate isomerase/epimerase [Edaphobacter lichenicola]
MPTRRDFLRLSALATAAGCTLGRIPSAFAADSPFIYGVQLYMVRKEAPQDLPGILHAIRQVGFTQIELFPIVYTHPAPELRRIVADSGLGLVSAHFDYASVPTKIDYAHQLGLEYMVCPMIPKDQWNLDGFHKAADDFNTWGRSVHDAGMQFVFHNHCYEFSPQATTTDGATTGFDELMKHTDPALVKLEFDMYWLAQAGQDPLTMLTRYANRVSLLHLKDRIANAPTGFVMGPTAKHITEMGKGTLNWPAIFAEAHKQGIRYAYLDQDDTTLPILDSLKENFAYLQTIKA